MNISEFLNKLGDSDLSSFIKVLQAYQEARKKGFWQVEYCMINHINAKVFIELEDNISIASQFGEDALYSPIDEDDNEFPSLDELIHYLKKVRTKMYKVTYKGNSTRFKDFEQIVVTPSERMAVEKVYFKHCDENYFPDHDGNIFDCDGNNIATPESNTIDYDGGYFIAELID